MSGILKKAFAGTMESSDVYVELAPADTLTVELQSVVEAQFGDAIDAVVREVLAENGVETAAVTIRDRGALECVIRARVETAVLRSREG